MSNPGKNDDGNNTGQSSQPDRSGFAIRRNDTCLASEMDCGRTAGPFRACCPNGSFCPASADFYNAYCCNEQYNNCTQSILSRGPFCANDTWTLYDNAGYFCCAPGTQGYTVGNHSSDGCASPGYDLASKEHYLRVAPQEQKGSASSSGPNDNGSGHSSNAPGSSSSSSTTSQPISTGAIAGAVVGAVVGVVALVIAVFFLIRFLKQRSRNMATRQNMVRQAEAIKMASGDWQSQPYEMDSRQQLVEMEHRPAKKPQMSDARELRPELESGTQPPAELPGDGRRR